MKGTDLRKLIKMNDLSMEDAARLLGISRGTLYERMKEDTLEESFEQFVRSKFNMPPGFGPLIAAPAPTVDNGLEQQLELYKKYVVLLEEKQKPSDRIASAYEQFIQLMQEHTVNLNDLIGLLTTQVRYQQVLVELKLLELAAAKSDGKAVDAVLRKYGVGDTVERKDKQHKWS